MELPLWPPIVALAIGGLMYAWVRWEGRRFDKRFPPQDKSSTPDA